MTSDLYCWIDGELAPLSHARVRADDSALLHGRGCYTTTRIERGRPRWPERHAARLATDARRLGIGEVDPQQALRALCETGRASFGEGDGVVRVQAGKDAEQRVHLLAVSRPLGPEPEAWSLRNAPFPYDGPPPWGGAKATNQLLYSMATDFAREAGVEEAVLCDRHGYLIEGARSSLLVVDETGTPVLPDLARGGVAGIARALLCERLAGIAVRNIAGGALLRAREIVALNAVRGARPCVRLDGRPVGDGLPGPFAREAAEALAEP